MKHILLLSTGGTIGSTIHNATIDTTEIAQLKLVQLFKQHYLHQDISFDYRQPYQILSENLVPCIWQNLITTIEAENLDNYDAIIITHGTDTLAYTACVLSFYFHTLNKPILLVSSDYPLEDKRANGLANFHCAIEFIRQQTIAGVFVPYQNQQHIMQVHLGTRLACSLQLSSDFFSVQNKPFMQFNNGQFTIYHPIKNPNNLKVKLSTDFNARILLIKPYPGLNYQHFDLHHVDAVLHDLYHSGTACATTQWGENYCLVRFIQQCRSQSIPVYLAPAVHSEATYQSTRVLMEHGAKALWNLSLEAAYVKLLLAYSNFKDLADIMNFMDTDLSNEHI